VQILLTPRLPVALAVVVPLLLALLVCQPSMGLCLLLTVAVPLLLALLVCQPSTGLRLLLAGGGAAPTTAPGLSIEHGPLRAARGHGLVVAARQRWTCGLDNPSYHALGGEGMPNYSFLTSVSDSTHKLVALRDQNLLECKRLVLEILYECFVQ